MVTVQEARIIAGEMLVEEYGTDFVLSNKDRLGTSVEYTEDAMNVYFDLSEKPINQYSDLFHADGKEHFPNVFYAVSVNVDDAASAVIPID